MSIVSTVVAAGASIVAALMQAVVKIFGDGGEVGWMVALFGPLFSFVCFLLLNFCETRKLDVKSGDVICRPKARNIRRMNLQSKRVLERGYYRFWIN